MTPEPLQPAALEAFVAMLDEAGDRLQELIDENTGEDSPAIQYYLDGAAFIEVGYLMVEQLAESYPEIYLALHHHYMPLFEKSSRGQISWAEALGGLPGFLREYAAEKVESELLFEEES